MPNSKERFTSRVSDYVKYRPTYPPQVLQTLKSDFNLQPFHQVADVGSGTGISTELFLKNGNTVFAIEPNEKMRQQAEDILSTYPTFKSLNGSSEKTSLANDSIDFIACAQAFHWFEPNSTKMEFQRILKSGGCVTILFNDRKSTGSPFSVRYEKLLKTYSTDYQIVNHRNIDQQRLLSFLGPYQEFNFPNHQDFDEEGLLGRLKSSSYSLEEGHPGFKDMVQQIKLIFNETQSNGFIRMEYQTQMYCAIWSKES